MVKIEQADFKRDERADFVMLAKNTSILVLTAILLSLFWVGDVSGDVPSVLKTPSRLERQVTRPEPLVVSAMRLLPHLPVGQGRIEMRRLLDKYADMYRRGCIRCGSTWIDGGLFDVKRDKYTREIDIISGELADLDRKMRTVDEDDDRKTIEADRYASSYRNQRARKLQQLARDWPDPDIMSFLLAQAKLLSGDEKGAEYQFTQCIRSNPFIAGFYQGRAMACDQALDSVTDWMMVIQLGHETEQAIKQLKAALDDVSTADLSDSRYVEARNFYRKLAEKTKSRRSRGARRDGTVLWDMPGEYWQCRADSLPVPCYDSFHVNNFVAAPIDSAGVFMLDSSAIKDALEMYLELPGHGSLAGRLLPLDILKFRSKGFDGQMPPVILVAPEELNEFSFESVKLDADADLTRLSSYELISTGLYRELDEGHISRRTVTFSRSVADGELVVAPSLMAGEGMGYIFSGGDDGGLAGLVTGRLDLDSDDGGKSEIISGENMVRLLDTAKKAFRYPSSARGKSLDELGSVRHIDGQVFIVHVVIGKK